MKFYPENFVVRLLFCIGLTIAAANLGMFVRAEIIAHEPFVFDPVKGLLMPGALGALAGFLWKPREQ